MGLKYEACDGCENNFATKPCPERPRPVERLVTATENGCSRAMVNDETGFMTNGVFTPFELIRARIDAIVKKS